MDQWLQLHEITLHLWYSPAQNFGLPFPMSSRWRGFAGAKVARHWPGNVGAAHGRRVWKGGRSGRSAPWPTPSDTEFSWCHGIILLGFCSSEMEKKYMTKHECGESDVKKRMLIWVMAFFWWTKVGMTIPNDVFHIRYGGGLYPPGQRWLPYVVPATGSSGGLLILASCVVVFVFLSGASPKTNTFSIGNTFPWQSTR